MSYSQLESKITVILPSLNVSKFIRQCMDSVVGQTYKNLEILCVDAGSTDSTLEILREYESKDDRVKVVLSDKKSYGYQVNMGISISCGEYIGIVETDDYIEPDMYEVMLKTLVARDAEMVKGKARKFYNDFRDEIYDGIINPLPIGDERFDQVISTYDYPQIIVSDIFLWLGLYKRELLSGIHLNETSGAAYQDIGFQIQVLTKAKRAVYIDRVVYNYRLDNASASSFNHNAFKYLDEEYDFALAFVKDSAWKPYVYSKMWNQTYARMLLMVRSGEYWDSAERNICSLIKKLSAAANAGYIDRAIIGDFMHDKLFEFLSEHKNLYEHMIGDFRYQLKEGREIIEKLRKLNVIIFGCGAWGRFLNRAIRHYNSEAELVLTDNNETFWDTIIDGTKALSPEKAIRMSDSALIVIANKKHAQDIMEQLLELGVNRDRIIIYSLGIIDPWVMSMILLEGV